MAPAEVERRLAASWPLPASWLRRLVSDHWSPGPTEERLAGEMTAADAPDLDKAIAAYEWSLRPAPDDVLQARLLALKADTRRQAQSDEDLEFQIRRYAKHCQAFPADIAVQVLETQAGYDPWWPAWADLAQRMGERSRRREKALEALRWLRRKLNAETQSLEGSAGPQEARTDGA